MHPALEGTLRVTAIVIVGVVIVAGGLLVYEAIRPSPPPQRQ